MSEAINFEQLDVGSGAVQGLDVSKYEQPGGAANKAFISVTTLAVNVRFDGVDPTTTEGHKVSPDTGFLVLTSYEEIRAFRMIGLIASTAKVSISYFRD